MTKTKLTVEDARGDVVRVAREIADSFTTPGGEFIADDLTRAEWAQLRQAIDRLDVATNEADR